MQIDISKIKNVKLPTGVDLTVTDIAWDTREMEGGELYLPLVGDNFDGHKFISQAFENGAIMSVCDKSKLERVDPKFHHQLILVDDVVKWLQDFVKEMMINIREQNPSVKVAAITGSAGKTTTREMLTQILSAKGRVLKTYKNYNTLHGNAKLLLDYDGEDFIVSEFGLGGPEEVRNQAEAMSPDVGIIVTIGAGHAGPAGGREAVYSGKKCLADIQVKNGKDLVLNIEDEGVARVFSEYKDYENLYTVGYGKSSADMSGELVDMSKDGTGFITNYKDQKVTVNINAIGRDYILNGLLAASAAVHFGFTFKEAISGLEDYEPYGMRFQVIEYESGAEIVNDSYNANMVSMRASLENFNAVWKSGAYYRVAILGDMKELGNIAEEEHEKLGALVREQNFEEVIFVGELFESFGQDHEITLEDAGKRVAELVKKGKENGREVAILLKASNSVRLYDIVPEVEE